LTPPARVDDAIPIAPERSPIDKSSGTDDVDTGRQDADDLVGVVPHRVVHDAVGLQRQQGSDVVRGGDADRIDAAELADVPPGLVG